MRSFPQKSVPVCKTQKQRFAVGVRSEPKWMQDRREVEALQSKQNFVRMMQELRLRLTLSIVL